MNKNGWMSCKLDGMPKEDGEYLVTLKGISNYRYTDILDFNNNLYDVDNYDFYNKNGTSGFYKYESEYGYMEVTNIIAWIPTPKPYEGE